MCRWFDSAPGHQEYKGLASARPFFRINVFAHLEDDILASAHQSYKNDVGQYREALRVHADETVDSPHFFRKVKWVIDQFNETISRSSFSDEFRISMGNY